MLETKALLALPGLWDHLGHRALLVPEDPLELRVLQEIMAILEPQVLMDSLDQQVSQDQTVLWVQLET